MKNILIIVLSFLALSAMADVPQSSVPEQESCAKIKATDKTAQQGCCSWHGGVCGCQGGRVVCCDGRYSPSCGCNKEGVTDNANEEA